MDSSDTSRVLTMNLVHAMQLPNDILKKSQSQDLKVSNISQSLTIST